MRRLLLAQPNGALPGSLPRGARAALKATMVAGHRTHIRRQASCISSQEQPTPAHQNPMFRPTPRKTINFSHHLSRPTQHLDVALRVYHGRALDPQSSEYQIASKLASLQDSRPSVVTAQMILYISPNLTPDLLNMLHGNQAWDNKLKKVMAMGFPTDHVFLWTKIITAKSLDEQARAFINHGGPKPIFILKYILGKALKNRDTMSVQSLYSLIEYCKNNPNDVLRSPRDADPLSSGCGVVSMNPAPIQEVLETFLALARRIRPQAVAGVADFAAACLEKLTPGSNFPDAVYRFRCSIFSSVLSHLATPPARSAYKHRRHGWKAMLRLLSLSSGLERPLVIDRTSYQAIRGVLLGVPKADSERDSATALSRTWPPYRILRNGIEEDTPLEEFASRSVKAGTMMMEAGYEKQLVDLITDVLGGTNTDGTPTLQTRSIMSPRSMAVMSLSDLWAAQVRATRNPEEAWQAFQRPPAPDMNPDAAVYEQMIYKLLARHAEEYHHNLPGDGRETFPFDDLNYSDFEKARLTPPTLDRLISVMVSDNIPLEGRILRTLLRHSSSTHQAILCIHQSSLPLPQQMTLENLFRPLRFRDSPEYLTRYRGVSPIDIRKIPMSLVQVAVEVLCRLHPNLTSAGLSAVKRPHLGRIHIARHVAHALASRRDPRLWEAILEALSRPNILLGVESPKSRGRDVLLFSGKMLADAQRSCDITPNMFNSFTRVVRKTMESIVPSLVESIDTEGGEALMTFSPTYTHPEASSSRPLLADWAGHTHQVGIALLLDTAQGAVKAMWHDLSGVRSANEHPNAGMVTGVSINNYMKVLAFVGDHVEMERLLRWTLEHITTVEEDGDIKGLNQLSRALCAFRAFAEPMLPAETVAEIRNEFEDPRGRIRRALDIQWPSDEEVTRYAEADQWGHRQQLIALLQRVRELQSDEDDGGEGGTRRERDHNALAEAWEPHEQLKKYLSRFRKGLAEHWGGAGLALYNRSKVAIGWHVAGQGR